MQETKTWETTTRSIDEGLRTGEIKLLFRDRKTIDREYLSTVAKIKRFLERWTGDRDFREALPLDPRGVTRKYNLDIDPEEIRLLWDEEYSETYDYINEGIPLKVRQYEAYIRECLVTRDDIRKQGSPVDPLFKAWRERQVSRVSTQLGFEVADNIVHAPFTIELSKGCSAGCWFCGVAAQRLEDVFPYSRENARLWREILEVLKEIIGPGAGQGFCYWATDPLDNPEYEKFLIDYHAVLNTFPQTTTTSSMKDPQRTRNLLKLSQIKDGEIERFSILTLKQLDRVHEEFSAEELMFVELVLQNDEANGTKAFAGRAREERFRKRLEAQELYSADRIGNTIACVSGFLLNMVDRSIKLISPCEADDEWPLGYRIYDEATFNTAEEFRAVVRQMIEKQMSLTLNLQDRIGFLSDLKYEEVKDSFLISSRAVKYHWQDKPLFQKVAKAVFNDHKNLTVGELALLLEREQEIALTHTLLCLNQFFQQGMLEQQVTRSN